MKNELLLLFLVGVSCIRQDTHLRAPQKWKFDNGVLVLNQQNFDQAVEEFHEILVDFYAPWCPHCQKLEPEFSLAAQDLQEHGITLAKVDCTVEHHLTKRFDIEGFPTLRVFAKDMEFPYHGHRTRAEITSYMLSHQDYFTITQETFLMTKVKPVNMMDTTKKPANLKYRNTAQLKRLSDGARKNKK